MRYSIPLLGFLLIAAWWTPVLAQADDPPDPVPLILTDAENGIPLGLHMELLEDPDGELTIADVTSSEYAARFVPSNVEIPNLGFTKSAYWVRVRLQNQNPEIDRWLLDVGSNMHYVDLYSPLPGSDGFEVTQTGAMRPASRWDILHPHILLDLTVPPHSQRTFYLRFENGASMTLPLSLWAPDAFYADSLKDQLLQGLFLGVMAGLLGYNLFLFFSLSDLDHFYLVLLLGGIILYDISQTRVLDVYVAPGIYPVKQYVISLAVGLIYIPLLLFNDSFLSANTLLPRMHKLNMLLIGLWVVAIVTAFFVSYHTLATIMAPLQVVTLVAAAASVVVAWRKGFRSARVLMVAWLVLLAGTLVFILLRLGIFSSNDFTESSYRLAFSWTAICWSLALADRVNLLQAETESANRSLQGSQDRLKQTLEAMPVGVVVYGPDEKPTFLNRRTAEILTSKEQGIGPDLSAGRTLEQMMAHFSFRIAGSDRFYPIEEMPVRRAVLGEAATKDDLEADLLDRRVQLEVWASPILDDEGNVESAVVAFQDITIRKQQEAELGEYRRQLERLVQERTEELSISNRMLSHEAQERAMLEEFLQRRIAWMSTFSAVRRKIRGTTDLPAAFEELSKMILPVLDAGSVFSLSWDNRNTQVDFLCGLRPSTQSAAGLGLEPTFGADSVLRGRLELGETVLLSAEEAMAVFGALGSCFSGFDFQSLLLVPMFTAERATGVLGVALACPEEALVTAQNELVTKIALDLATLSQDATMLDQSRALVASEERNLLARDLHDSVTQVLFSASLVAEVLPQIWRRDPALAMQSLQDLRRLTRGALAEMRAMLLELRPSAVAKSPLADLLTQLTEASTSRADLPFKLFIEKTPVLPMAVHLSYYRIAQEALNNIAKHARARQVTVSLSAAPVERDPSGAARYEVRLLIEDDGAGFAPQNGNLEHLGMGIMRERAADIGASLTVESQVGQGTRVTLLWSGAVAEER